MTYFKAVFMLAAAAGIFQVLAQDDGIALLQGAVETKKATVAIDIDDDGEDYHMSESLNCKSEGSPAVTDTAPSPPEVDLSAAIKSPDTDAAPASAPSDPPGATLLRGILSVMIFLVICDGMYRWSIQSRSPRKQVSATVTMQRDQELAEESAWVDMVAATRNGDESNFASAVKKKPRLTKTDTWGCTPLHFAAAGGSAAITSEILKSKVDIDALDAMEDTPLHFAARAGHASICEMLLDAGAKMDQINDRGMTPLVVAGHSKAEAACQLLADRGAGCGGMSDEELPPLVVSQLIRRLFAVSN